MNPEHWRQIDFGPYRIEEVLGKGGMGEVFRATDTRLNRQVAVKVCNEQSIARFKREAKAISALNHPHICTLHDVGPNYLIMELIEGETLAERIHRGRLPTGEALELGRQIAEALEAAHANGIVHRDLKPANIKVTPDGNVKVLDFGLASIRGGNAPGGSEGVTISMSTPGMIVGTPAYMSPEQARGEEADRMIDIWAFGCVLFEMLAGSRPFDGKTSTDVLASVLKAQPAWDRLPAEVPQAIRRLLRHCLQKDRKDRLHDIADARIEIVEVQRTPTSEERSSHSETRSRWFPLLTAILMFVAGASAGWFLRSDGQLSEMRLDIMAPPGPFEISPDGNSIAYGGNSDGQSQLFLRPMNAESGTPIPGAESALLSAWSPDSRFIVFHRQGKLYIVDTQGGGPRFLTDAFFPGSSWNKDGVILFSRGTIFSIAARGGEATQVTRLIGKQPAHFAPRFLPDGKHFVYFVPGSDQPKGIYVDELGKSSPRHLVDADSSGVYVAGYLLFERQGTLLAQPFNLDNTTLTGEPSPVAQGISSAISASSNGRIVYQKAPTRNSQRQFVWFNRDGTESRKIGPPLDVFGGSLSAGGRYVYFNQDVAGNTNIWRLDTDLGSIDPFTSDAALEALPVISPDGKSIAYSSNARGGEGFDISWSPLSQPRTARSILSNGKGNSPTDWSSEGLLYRSMSDKGDWDIWLLPIDGNGAPGTPRALVQTGADERDAQFSPDGKWIVYRSDKSGIPEIYIQPLTEAAEAKRISILGGTQPRWVGDEVFFVDRGKLMSGKVRFSRGGVTTEPPVPLFDTGIGDTDTINTYFYVVGPDAKTFLVDTTVDGPPSPIHVLLNWKPKAPLR